jgi:DNA-binding NtrC family response regulator
MTKILLVDDDPLHASVRKAILQRKFQDVRRVGDAAEALCLLEQPQFTKNLGIVVTSSQHSGIGLVSFISELHTRIPNLPVLVIGETDKDQAALADFSVRFLQRPVKADDLLSAVGQILASRPRIRLKTA